jgi:hypothetical protein
VASITDRLARNNSPTIRIANVSEIGEYWRTIPPSDPRFDQITTEPNVDDPIRAPEQTFISELNSRLAGSKRVLLYVPGYNTPFTHVACSSVVIPPTSWFAVSSVL